MRPQGEPFDPKTKDYPFPLYTDQHYLIEKKESSGRTFTEIFSLDQEARKRELARLHGGENITETTLLSAGEQLDAAERYKRSGR